MTDSLPLLGCPTHPQPRALLEEGGFAGWLAHIVDEHGNGALLSWGFGAGEARGGDVGEAGGVPSLSLLLMAQGAAAFWLHQRYRESDAAWEVPAGRWRFGKSQIETLRDLHSQVVIARLDCALPGTSLRLQGHLEMGGVPRRASGAVPPTAAEEWAPLMGPGEGRAILSVGGAHRFHLAGRAVHARHGSAAPLPWALGGYAPFVDHTRSFQVRLASDGELVARGVAIYDDGREEAAPALRVELEGSLAGWRSLTLYQGDAPWLQVKKTALVHERGVGAHVLTQNRAPLTLPAPGIVEESRDDATKSAARDFVHHVGDKNPWRVRLENGVVVRRWRRLVGL
jgi:hypothetical protein